MRVAKTVNGSSTQFTWDTQGDTPLPLSDSSSSYLNGPDGLPLEQITGSATLFYHHDQLGSTTMLTNGTGKSVDTYVYATYGQLISSTGTAINPLRFASQYQDVESGLDYLRARYYDPSTGQFVGVDPALSVTAEPFGYADDDPVDISDPTGMWGLLSRAFANVAAWAGWQGMDQATDDYLDQMDNYLVKQGPMGEIEAGSARTVQSIDSYVSAVGELEGAALIQSIGFVSQETSKLAAQNGASSWVTTSLDYLSASATWGATKLEQMGIKDL